ncbi:hypothetical protein LguiA_033217 [Lonicera macranthoides]
MDDDDGEEWKMKFMKKNDYDDDDEKWKNDDDEEKWKMKEQKSGGEAGLIGVVFGSKGTAAILSVEYYCCDRPNPIIQEPDIFWIVISWDSIVVDRMDHLQGICSPVSVCFFICVALVVQLTYTSLLAVGVGILLFLLTSFSDPGTVNAENVSQYLSSYPYDNVIYIEKECSTCKIPKPARSKHCSICNRCVAGFDHHCGWLNNCIGEGNTRYFMAFLLWHFLLYVYGTVAIALVLAGQLKDLQVIYILTGECFEITFWLYVTSTSPPTECLHFLGDLIALFVEQLNGLTSAPSALMK